MWDLALITIFINYLLYVGFFSSSQYGIGVLHKHQNICNKTNNNIFSEKQASQG